MRILVVDDEPVIQRTLKRMLERAGHECDTAATTDEAREKLSGIAYPLILCDVNLPGESGLELIQEVLGEDRQTAVVMVSAEHDPRIAEIALEAGAYGYVIKPFEPSEILISVQNALRRRELELQAQDRSRALEELVDKRTAELQSAVERLESAEAELRKSQRETIERLARAAEFRHDETGQHIGRMARYCEALARRLGLAEEECQMIRLASPMHDVGKLCIPDHILMKPGRLTDEELTLMRDHAQLGHRLLAGSGAPLLDVAATIALTHHERWDGTGYPAGLTGRDIPLVGRIAAVVDVFDALTSARVYKDSFSVERSLEIIRGASGTHFDPAVVSAFFESLDEILEIRDSLPDDHR